MGKGGGQERQSSFLMLLKGFRVRVWGLGFRVRVWGLGVRV